MTVYFALLPAMTLLGAAGSLFFKKASGHSSPLSLILDTKLYIGGFLYLASAVLNIIALQKMDYSTVLPLTSLTYIWTMALARAALGEKITKRKICGVIFIFIGALCISAA